MMLPTLPTDKPVQQYIQVDDPSIYDKDYRTYAILFETERLRFEAFKRAEDQKELVRLMVPLFIITAASAAALAIPFPLNAHWLTAPLYTAAFGVSLEGLLLATYLAVLKSPSSKGMIGRLANGRAHLQRTVGLVAFVTVLPHALVAPAALLLLGGLVAMTGVLASESSIAEDNLKAAFQTSEFIFIQIFTTLGCLAVLVITCEVFVWMEVRRTQTGDTVEPERLPFLVEQNTDGKY
ncbi:unnamed protein product [Rhizoctonia solani]|nr:unnamed protein product [Rhizoctonia solani]